MNRDEVTRGDFPRQDQGYDRASVDAHLAAVAVAMEALEARIHAGEVERDALRRNAGTAADTAAQAPPARLPTPIAAVPDLEPADADEPVAEVEPVGRAELIEQPVEETAVLGEVQPAKDVGPDESSARLVAMKMALDGADRDAVKAKLDESFSLADVDGLIDDVLKRVG